MFIFIRHAEKSEKDDINLSSAGFVRRNELPYFFIKKYNNKLNIPERIIAMKQHTEHTSNRPYQTVSFLGYELKIKIENEFKRKEINEAISTIIDDINTDILICWEHTEMVEMIERLIHKMYNYKIKLKWGKNPLSYTEDHKDYTSIWVLDPIKHTLNVYNQLEVIYNDKLSRYDVIYDNVKNVPLFTISLGKTYLTWIKSFFYN
jgi:hypothetical protein